MADGSWVSRTAIASALDRDPRFVTDDPVASWRDLPALPRQRRAVVIDPFSWPDTTPAGALALAIAAAERAVVVSAGAPPARVLAAREAGAAGYIDRSAASGPEEVADAIWTAIEGDGWHGPDADGRGLTSVELRFLAAICEGRPYAEIARETSYSLQHVRNTASVIGRKLGVHGRQQVAAEAMRRGLWLPVDADGPADR